MRLACPEEVELAYAPLLLALDDGSRCGREGAKVAGPPEGSGDKLETASRFSLVKCRESVLERKLKRNVRGGEQSFTSSRIKRRGTCYVL